MDHTCHALPRQPALKRVVSLPSLTNKTNHQRCGGSRVLTSAECLKEIEEKERAKKRKDSKVGRESEKARGGQKEERGEVAEKV